MEPHGWAEIERQGRVLYMRLIGAWNLEAFERLMSEIRTHATELRGRPWATLYDVTQWELSALEVLEPFRDFTREMDDQDRTHVAIVSAGKWLLHAFIADLSAEMGAEHRIFEDERAARSWLTASGIPTSE